MLLRPVVPLAIVFALTGCTQNSGIIGAGSSTTGLRLEPRVFASLLPCQAGLAGGFQHYTATLSDVLDAEVSLPSSPPIPCRDGVEFTQLTAGKLYLVEIDGYDRADLVSVSVGSRALISAEGEVVAARWQLGCGAAPRELPDPTDAGPADAGAQFRVPEQPLTALRGAILPFTSCGGLVEKHSSALATALVLDIDQLDLGDAGCTSLAVTVYRDGETDLVSTVAAPCAGSATIELEPGQYRLVVSGGAPGVPSDAGVPDAGSADAGPPAPSPVIAECFGRAQEGLQLPTVCY